MKSLKAIKIPNVADYIYESDDGYVMRRESNGKWVLRDGNARVVGTDRCRNDLAELYDFRINYE